MVKWSNEDPKLQLYSKLITAMYAWGNKSICEAKKSKAGAKAKLTSFFFSLFPQAWKSWSSVAPSSPSASSSSFLGLFFKTGLPFALRVVCLRGIAWADAGISLLTDWKDCSNIESVEVKLSLHHHIFASMICLQHIWCQMRRCCRINEANTSWNYNVSHVAFLITFFIHRSHMLGT